MTSSSSDLIGGSIVLSHHTNQANMGFSALSNRLTIGGSNVLIVFPVTPYVQYQHIAQNKPAEKDYTSLRKSQQTHFYGAKYVVLNWLYCQHRACLWAYLLKCRCKLIS